MRTRLTIYLATGIVLIIILMTLILAHNFSSPDPLSSIPAATSLQISTSSRAALSAKTPTTTLVAPAEPIIAQATMPVISQPSSTLVAATTTIASTAPQNNDPAQIAVDPQAIVGILCYYNATYTDQETGQTLYEPDDEEVRGSGVIINSRGNILTNRHIIEQPDSMTTLNDQNGNAVPVTVSYGLDHCDVGQLPAGATLPTAAQIESINPYIQIPVLGYTAQPVFVSQTAGVSSVEIQYADFALLAITGVSSSGPTFGVTSVPASFPYATLLPIEYHPDILNGQVITYGFPGDLTTAQGNFFQTLTMSGSVGTVTSVEDGDEFYAATPLLIDTDLAIAHGRSGSPLFWRGYVVGIVTFFVGDNQTDSGSVASDAILKGLHGTGYIPND